MAVDAVTGKKHQVLSYDHESFDVCPATGAQTIYIGRTEYSIAMFDSHKQERKWNVTFFDYTSGSMDSEKLNDYGNRVVLNYLFH
jgi:serine/threonine-protein kinase/endoribonuclease IRE1